MQRLRSVIWRRGFAGSANHAAAALFRTCPSRSSGSSTRPTCRSSRPTHLRIRLTVNGDARGALAEFVKGGSFGQIFVSRTRPGVTRGHHYHQTKVEKFLVVEGEAVIRFRQIDGDGVIAYPVAGQRISRRGHPAGLHALDRERRPRRTDHAVLGQRSLRSRPSRYVDLPSTSSRTRRESSHHRRHPARDHPPLARHGGARRGTRAHADPHRARTTTTS